LITIQLGFTNLVLAVIVERATKATEKDAEERVKERQAWHVKAAAKLWSLMKEIDKDQSGSISLDEMLEGFAEVPELAQLLILMDIKERDLAEMFEYLADDNGVASYERLVESLERCESEDLRRQTMLMSLQLTRIRETVTLLTQESKNQKGRMASPRSPPDDRRGGPPPPPPPPGGASDLLNELEFVQKESRDHFEDSLRGLGESLDEQWAALERRFKKQAEEQAATLSRHTQMLSQIAAATGSSPMVEPKDVESVYSAYNTEDRGRYTTTGMFRSGSHLTASPKSIPSEATIAGAGADSPKRKRSSKQSRLRDEENGRNADRWRNKSFGKRSPGQ